MFSKALTYELANLSNKDKLYMILIAYKSEVIKCIKEHGQKKVSTELDISQAKLSVVYNILKELDTDMMYLIYEQSSLPIKYKLTSHSNCMYTFYKEDISILQKDDNTIRMLRWKFPQSKIYNIQEKWDNKYLTDEDIETLNDLEKLYS